jgi:hypothetical protein
LYSRACFSILFVFILYVANSLDIHVHRQYLMFLMCLFLCDVVL